MHLTDDEINTWEAKRLYTMNYLMKNLTLFLSFFLILDSTHSTIPVASKLLLTWYKNLILRYYDMF